MNARERLFAVLDGKPTDHTPIWLLFPYHRAAYYGDVRNEPSYLPVFEASKKYAIMLNRRNPQVATFTPDVTTWQDVFTDHGDEVQRSYIQYRGKQIFSEIRKQKYNTQVKKLLATDEDLEFYCSLPINLDPVRITAELDEYLPTYLQEMSEFPLEFGSMMLDLGEPVGQLYRVSKLEEYAVWSLTHSDLIVNFFDRMMQQKRVVYRYFLERNLADIYFLVGSELASPPLVSRKTFQRWILPYAGELISLVHTYGAKVIQHYHGMIKQILPDILTMQPDALHTIEAPPVGNCTFTEAYQVVKDQIALIGNIQYDDFRSNTPDQMAQAVRTVLDECRGKRLILSPSAGPYEPAISERVAANYLIFMQTAWNYQV